MLHRLGRFVIRHRYAIAAAWVVFAIGLTVVRELGRREDLEQPDAAGNRLDGGDRPPRRLPPSPGERDQPGRARGAERQAHRLRQLQGRARDRELARADADEVRSTVSPLSSAGKAALSRRQDDRLHLGDADRQPLVAHPGRGERGHRRRRRRRPTRDSRSASAATSARRSRSPAPARARRSGSRPR